MRPKRAWASAEHQRLDEANKQGKAWRKWGPYLSERAWGTVREDYSPYGAAWEYFPHDHARSRAYRWNEDGLAGICDDRQYLCFALALWNGRDPILKERLFGLTGPEGNHGEDVKEVYFYLDSTPTHSYMKMLYKYPQAAFPYTELVAENGRRGYYDFEYELLDTGVFAEDRYFDVLVEYAKVDAEDILVRISATNRGPETAELTLLPTLWFRNTWSWGYEQGPMADVAGKPRLLAERSSAGNPFGKLPSASSPRQARSRPGQAGAGKEGEMAAIRVEHPAAGPHIFFAEGAQTLLFTENETNHERLFGSPNASPYTKDAFHRYVIAGEEEAVNPQQEGTKGAAVYRLQIPAGETRTIRLRLARQVPEEAFAGFDDCFEQRIAEANAFYAAVQRDDLGEDARNVQRQAFAGMLWSKQLYYYDIDQWLRGDPAGPRPPSSRREGRNSDWSHLNNFDILSMPDKWEFPWYAAWDLAFHCLPLVLLDPAFAKRQLELMCRVWYLHPNGQLPAYEWAFGDVNPPVHAWAAWRVYKIDARRTGQADRDFLERIFHKLLLAFTWWVNRKDEDGNNVFQGGFLGLDNVSLFDRSAALPRGGRIDQSDGTAWMAFFSLTMLHIALELARENPVYQAMATKFFEHFLAIANAMAYGFDGQGLWDEEDGFFYDVLHLPDDSKRPLRVRSLVGLVPIVAVETMEENLLTEVPDFKRRLRWFLEHRQHLIGNMLCTVEDEPDTQRHILGIVTPERLKRVLAFMLDEAEFLSPYGIRSLSKVHQAPYEVDIDGESFSINYQPAEAESGLFGGNSNWRGPVWFPINFLLIEGLQRYHYYYGDDLKVEFPTGSGQEMNLWEISVALSERLIKLFLRDEEGRRPIYGGARKFQDDVHWRDYLLFHEFFHGDDGAGLGANHQTGWTGLVAKLIQQSGGAG